MLFRSTTKKGTVGSGKITGTTKKQLEKIETNIFPVDGVEYENYSDSEEEEEDDE